MMAVAAVAVVVDIVFLPEKNNDLVDDDDRRVLVLVLMTVVVSVVHVRCVRINVVVVVHYYQYHILSHNLYYHSKPTMTLAANVDTHGCVLLLHHNRDVCTDKQHDDRSVGRIDVVVAAAAVVDTVLRCVDGVYHPHLDYYYYSSMEQRTVPDHRK